MMELCGDRYAAAGELREIDRVFALNESARTTCQLLWDLIKGSIGNQPVGTRKL